MRIALLGVIASLSIAGCATTVSVPEMKRVQDNEGFFSQSLYYSGSTRTHHYFDQFKLFDKGFWNPLIVTDGYDSFRVLRLDLALPAELEFRRRAGSERRTKVRIKDDAGYAVDQRRTTEERLAARRQNGVGLSRLTNARLNVADDGSYFISFSEGDTTTNADSKVE